MGLTIRDRNIDKVRALHKAFEPYGEVTVEFGDIFARPAWALVSPANSFGFMDGGIDAAYLARWPHVEHLVRDEIALANGVLPVGDWSLVMTGDKEFPVLIILPTMLGPMGIESSTNVFMAFWTLCEVNRLHPKKEIVCPGLGMGIGAMPPERAARQMATAYALFTKQGDSPDNSREAHKLAMSLLE